MPFSTHKSQSIKRVHACLACLSQKATVASLRFSSSVSIQCFLQRDEGSPPLVHSLASGFMTPGPGKDKTLLLRQCTNSDFARRMKATSRHLFWMGEEAWFCLDVAWATSKGKKEHSTHKVQHCFLQNTQNGLSYGPVSIHPEQFFFQRQILCSFSYWSAQSHP